MMMMMMKMMMERRESIYFNSHAKGGSDQLLKIHILFSPLALPCSYILYIHEKKKKEDIKTGEKNCV